MSKQICALLLATFVYLMLVSGGVIPYADGDAVKAGVKGGMLVIVIFLGIFNPISRSSLALIATFLCFGLIFMCLGLLHSSNISYALEKIDGALLCSVIVALVIEKGYARYGEQEFQAAFLCCALIILIATIAYKVQFGLFDRQVKFLLNGPIVYGWLMGFCALLSLNLWEERRKVFWGLLLVVFICALLWTESKGAAVAFAVAAFVLLLNSLRKNLKYVLLGVLLLTVVYVLFYDQLIYLFMESRFAAVARVLTGEVADVDDGSIGVRSLLAEHALEDFRAHPFLGIGLGEFSYDSFVYPHNQHLEIFTELGIFAGMAHIGFVMLALFRAGRLNRAVILFFVGASAFSGDVSYLRFLYAFCLHAQFRCEANTSNQTDLDYAASISASEEGGIYARMPKQSS
ncbi:O-antigen ligase family protein [Variovorax sp. J22R133]|uniref:O-antigen ligase family protein n=1 Tax=Variovorax brevis TaxID=3053503 RepID=UPI002575EC8F|nr:O-antigen ligase family protein [Variovorax sp. J22R133]MDM0110727.1 O-antigen ligase family protein [Variovorax sp. J22R133]